MRLPRHHRRGALPPIYTVEAEIIGTPLDVLVFEQNPHTFEGFLMK